MSVGYLRINLLIYLFFSPKKVGKAHLSDLALSLCTVWGKKVSLPLVLFGISPEAKCIFSGNTVGTGG